MAEIYRCSIVGVGDWELPLLLLESVRNRLTYGDKLLLDVVNVGVFVAFSIDLVRNCLWPPVERNTYDKSGRAY